MSTIAEVRHALAAGMTPAGLWRQAQEAITAWNDPALCLHRAEACPDMAEGPLAGVVVAVKDNIDVAGMPTTAGCPGFRRMAAADATAVARLRAAGAMIVGKTNLDQFATGLVGTRSPYGTPRHPIDPRRIPGGSSSGSACAVAAGVCPVALGTDTAGSGRIPAAFTGIVGFKPTRGWIPTTGVVPACRSLDCVSVFALTVEDAWETVRRCAGPAAEDPYSRVPERPLLPGPQVRVGVLPRSELAACDPAWIAGYDAAIAALVGLGHVPVEIDFAPFREAAALLYGGAFVAERTAAVGEAIARGIAGLDPTVAAIISGGARPAAAQAFRDLDTLAGLRLQARRQWDRCDILVLPTAPRHPTLAEVAADPVGVNSGLGRYTNFANLLDTCAVAVPSGLSPDGIPVGVTCFAPAWHDLLVARVAAVLQDRLGLPLGATGRRLEAPQRIDGDDGGVALAVFGAHLSGQPLHHELLACGARLAGPVRTSADYRLYALATTPPKPGLFWSPTGGAPIRGELWRLPAAGFGTFVAGLPRPMCIGSVVLEDGRLVKGFLAEMSALAGASDITAYGGWLAWKLAGGTV